MTATLLHETWEFNVLGVSNYRTSSKLSAYFDFIKNNVADVPGDIVEAGVFQGRSLLATAMLLKELGSDRKVFGFDSFSGFPPVYHENDQLEKFDELATSGRISHSHADAAKRLKEYRAFLKGTPIDVKNISSSEAFAASNRETLERKIDFLGLDNVVLVPGPFNDTMTDHPETPSIIMATLIDCDLYDSYHTTLDFVWPRLSDGGFLFLDEYFSLKFAGARIACDEFFADKADKPERLSPPDEFFERWCVKKNGETA